jgi:hypothetical protein
MKIHRKIRLSLFILSLALWSFLSVTACVTGPSIYTEKTEQTSDHFHGIRYFNPDVPQSSSSPSGQTAKRGPTWWVWKWILRSDWPEWPKRTQLLLGPSPANRAPEGWPYITPVGHATFLIQMDGVNILTDPMWSERCSPVSWAGPKRYSKAGKVAGKKVKTAEDFIKLCASQSSITGEPYLMRLADGTTVKSEVFFRNKLKTFSTDKP